MSPGEHDEAERGRAGHAEFKDEGLAHEGLAHEGFDHEGFDCSRARLQFFEYLDGEMGPDDCDRIRQHLASCGPCLKEYDIDQTLKALVRRSCGREAAPMELRMQILSRITTVIVTVELKD